MLFSLGPITALTGAAGGALAGSRQGELDAINKKNLLMQGQQNQWNLNEQDALWEDKVKQALATSRLTQQQTAADSSLVDDKTRLAKQDLGLQYKIGGAQGELFDRTRDVGIGTGVNLATSAYDTSSQESQLLQVTQALNDIKANPGKTIANLTALGVAPSAIQGDAITGYKVNGIPAEQFLLGHRQTIMSATLAQVGQPYAPAGQSKTIPESSLPAGSNRWTLGGSPVLFSSGADGIARVDKPGNMYHGMPVTEFEKVVKGSPSQTGPIPKPTRPVLEVTSEGVEEAKKLIQSSELNVVNPKDLANAEETIARSENLRNYLSTASTLPPAVRDGAIDNLLKRENSNLRRFASGIYASGGKFPEGMSESERDQWKNLAPKTWGSGELKNTLDSNKELARMTLIIENGSNAPFKSTSVEIPAPVRASAPIPAPVRASAPIPAPVRASASIPAPVRAPAPIPAPKPKPKPIDFESENIKLEKLMEGPPSEAAYKEAKSFTRGRFEFMDRLDDTKMKAARSQIARYEALKADEKETKMIQKFSEPLTRESYSEAKTLLSLPKGYLSPKVQKVVEAHVQQVADANEKRGRAKSAKPTEKDIKKSESILSAFAPDTMTTSKKQTSLFPTTSAMKAAQAPEPMSKSKDNALNLTRNFHLLFDKDGNPTERAKEDPTSLKFIFMQYPTAAQRAKARKQILLSR